MRVLFKFPCFVAADAFKRPDGQHISGQHYEKGIHEVPEGTKLPSNVEILRDGPGLEEPLPIPQRGVNPIHQYDLARAAGENQDKAIKESTTRMQPAKRKPGRPKKYA